MSIVGLRPSGGVRIVLARPREGGPPWRYEGVASTADAESSIVGTIDAAGEVRVEVAPTAPPDLGEKVRLILRSVHKQAASEGLPAPPVKIVRWRPRSVSF